MRFPSLSHVRTLAGALLIGSALLLALAGCGGATSTGEVSPTATTAEPTATTAQPTATKAGNEVDVHMTGGVGSFKFNPASVTIKVGTTVVWTNTTNTAHTSTSDATSGPNSWQSNELDPAKSFSFTFTQAGTFTYHCDFHPNMTGTVIVTP